MRMRLKNSFNGFTLMEILVVVVIVGVIAGFGMPTYATHVERVRASEGVQMLTSLLAAQERYRVENNAYATAIANLDIDIPNASNFTVPPTLRDEAGRVAALTRTNNSYTLCINSTGVVSCSGTANICAQYAAGGALICP